MTHDQAAPPRADQSGWLQATDWELHSQLPATVGLEAILTAHDVHATNPHGTVYRWNGWTFEVPPGVFDPGDTNRFLCGLLLDQTLPVAGCRYAAMGAGLGVEVVTAGVCGARSVHAFDVHQESVEVAGRHYARIVGPAGPPFTGIVGDLWDGLSDATQFDVVTFNPPLIDVRLSDDPYIVRNRCVGPGLAQRFFDQVRTRSLLAPGGVIYLTLTNTSPLRDVVAMALHAGFHAWVLAVLDWPVDRVCTFLIALRDAPYG